MILFFLLFLVHVKSSLIYSGERNEIQITLDLLKTIIISLDRNIALIKNLKKIYRDHAFDTVLTRFQTTHHKLSFIIFKKEFLSIFCGHYKLTSPDPKQDIINYFQIFDSNPWLVFFRLNRITYPIIPKSMRGQLLDELIKEAIENKSIILRETKCHNIRSWIIQSITKYLKVDTEHYIISNLKRRFGKDIPDYKSIFAIFDTDMPCISPYSKYYDLIKVYVEFPHYSFSMKPTADLGNIG